MATPVVWMDLQHRSARRLAMGGTGPRRERLGGLFVRWGAVLIRAPGVYGGLPDQEAVLMPEFTEACAAQASLLAYSRGALIGADMRCGDRMRRRGNGTPEGRRGGTKRRSRRGELTNEVRRALHGMAGGRKGRLKDES